MSPKTPVHDCMIALFDGKFDPALFHATVDLAMEEGRTLKWFCPFRDIPRTFAYNPVKRCAGKPIEVFSGFIVNIINAYAGPDYARQHYYYEIKRFLEESLQNTPTSRLQSFRDVYAILRAAVQNSRGQYRDGADLLNIIGAISHFDALHVSSATHNGHPALAHEIDFLKAIENKEVIYCILPASGDFASAGMFYRMAHYDLRQACREYRLKHGNPARVVTLNDEAHVLFGGNLVSTITQGREFGCALALFYQDQSQSVIPGGMDLSPLLANNTVTKIFHSVRDPDHKLKMAQNSGTAVYADFDYGLSAEDIAAGRLGPEHATIGGTTDIGVRQRLGPRLEIEDIDDASRDVHKALARIDKNQGLSQLNGTAMIHIPWQMSEREFRRRSRETRFPESDGAIDHDLLKAVEEKTVAPAEPSQKAKLDDALRRLQEKLGGEKP